MEPIICTKEIDNTPCGASIDLIRENLNIVRPEIPLLAAICPACGNSRILEKGISGELAELYFKDEIETAKTIREQEEEAEMMPSVGIANKLRDALALLGYKGKRWSQKVKAIVEFAQTVPMYQTPQGLHQLLAGWGVDAQHCPMIIFKVFGGADMQAVPQYGGMGGQSQQGYSYPGLNYQGSGVSGPQQQPQDQQQFGGYSMASTPNGQVILVPNPNPAQGSCPTIPQNQPIIIDRGSMQKNETGMTVREIVDAEGNVKERIITQPANAAGVGQQTIDPVSMMEKMSNTFSSMMGTLQSNQPNTQQLSESDKYERERLERQHKEEMGDLKGLMGQQNQMIDALKDQMHKDEMNQLKNAVVDIGEQMRYMKDARQPGQLSDLQYKTRAQTENLETVSQHLEQIGERVIEPLAEGQKMQAKSTAALQLRQLELQDNVPPGTYINAVFASSQPTDDEVKSKTKRWKDKAAAVKEKAE